jgi:hypothetical protein
MAVSFFCVSVSSRSRLDSFSSMRLLGLFGDVLGQRGLILGLVVVELL